MATRIGLQTFTVRRLLKTPVAIDTGFARLAAMGLGAVELAYVKLEPKFIDALEAAGKQHNIEFRSSQIKFDILDKQRDWMLRLHEQLACTNTAVSVLPFSVIRGNRDDLLVFSEKLEALGQWYKERGIQLCFHHHDFEFRPYGDALGFDQIVANTSPENVGLELDSYWLQRSGVTPQAMIRRLGSRVKVLHLRDYRVRLRLFDMLPGDAELGAGNLDITQIIRASLEAEIPLLAIEQNTRTPYESLDRSLAHVRELGFGDLLSA